MKKSLAVNLNFENLIRQITLALPFFGLIVQKTRSSTNGSKGHVLLT